MALGLQQWLKEHGLDLYIDWQDASMPETPDGTTAGRIRTMIRNADVFLFLATSDSLTSRWCPWELGFADGVKRNPAPTGTSERKLGFADGVKRNEQIAVISTRDGSGNYFGNEYLQLYRRIEQSEAGRAEENTT